MITKENYKKIINVLLCAFIVFNVLPIKINYANGPLILLLAFAVFGLFSKLKNKIYNYQLLVIAIPMLVYILGMINTENIEYGFKFIGRNVYFIAFPLIFLNKTKETVEVNMIYKVYLISLALVNVYLIYLFVYYFNIGERFYKVVSYDIYHSTYLGMYNLFAFWIVKFSSQKLIKKNLKPVLLLFFIICAVVTSSRIIVILSVLSIIVSAFIYFKFTFRFFVMLAIIVGITFVLLLTIPSLNEKFMQLLEVKGFSFNRSNYLSVSSRFAKLEAAFSVIRDHTFFGTGTGDLMDELVRIYKEMNFTMGYKNRYNPHNQFLDNISRNGIILGTAALFSVYIWPLALSFFTKNKMLLAFGFVIVGVSLTESILNVQRGIAFCTFFLTLLMFNATSKTVSKIDETT